MPTAIETVLLFPGQGAHRDDALPALARRHPQVTEVFDEVDSVAADFGARQPGATGPATPAPPQTIRSRSSDRSSASTASSAGRLPCTSQSAATRIR